MSNKEQRIAFWGKDAGKRIVQLPVELLFHYKDIGLSDEELVIILWIKFHQWGSKDAFPHPAKLASVLNCDYGQAVQKLKSLKMNGLITLEPTKSGNNFYQNIAPLRDRLLGYLANYPQHCEVIKQDLRKSRIDISTNRRISLIDTSNSIDTSIPHKGTTTSIADELKKYKKKE